MPTGQRAKEGDGLGEDERDRHAGRHCAEPYRPMDERVGLEVLRVARVRIRVSRLINRDATKYEPE